MRKEKPAAIRWQTTFHLAGGDCHSLLERAKLAGHTIRREIVTPVLNPKHCPPYDFGTPKVYYWIENDKRVFRDPAALMRAVRRKPCPKTS